MTAVPVPPAPGADDPWRHNPSGPECPSSQRVDGKFHSWRFDGDDPYTVCVYCGERRSAVTGKVIGP